MVVKIVDNVDIVDKYKKCDKMAKNIHIGFFVSPMWI